MGTILNGYTSSYVSYAAPLLLTTGYFLVRFDAAGYKKQNMRGEGGGQKLSWFLGWTNIVLGVTMYVAKGIFY